MPTMSSISSRNTGIREYPCFSTMSWTSRSVLSTSMATTSGRGTMTSRTMVSPNWKMEWMRSASSSSISDSSEATSAMVRISCSVT